MENILQKKHYRSAFYIIILLIVIIAIILRFFVLPQFDPTLITGFLELCAALLDGLLISLIVTVLIGSFVFWLTPEIVKKAVIEVIEPKEIGPLLTKATVDTKSWIYKGACGRYTSATTLPALAKAAKSADIGRDIRLTVLNPGNSNVCSEYAIYRKSLRSSEKDYWSTTKVQELVLATIVSALRLRHNEPLLRIDIFLIDHFSAFRLDISDQYVVITKEDAKAAGLRADKGSYFYDSYIDDVRLSERQSKEVTFKNEVPMDDQLTNDSLKEIILQADLISVEVLENLDLSAIADGIKLPKDPYA
ncbi:hypothetical protein ACFL3W_01355 [Pseudomonadota bacterium]